MSYDLLGFLTPRFYDLLFGILIGTPITAFLSGAYSYWRDSKYRDWTLKLVMRDGTTSETYPIYPEDIKRIEGNDMELWKSVVKSNASTFGTIQHTHIAKAKQDGWLIAPDVGSAERQIVIDFSKMSDKVIHFHQPPWPNPSGRVIGLTRHSATATWLRSHIGGVEIYEHLDQPLLASLTAGDTVVGTLPITLIAQLTKMKVFYTHFAVDVPEGLRGKELTLDQLETHGARLESYTAAKRDV
jgi:CRISPR-associated protein Csx16